MPRGTAFTGQSSGIAAKSANGRTVFVYSAMFVPSQRLSITANSALVILSWARKRWNLDDGTRHYAVSCRYVIFSRAQWLPVSAKGFTAPPFKLSVAETFPYTSEP